MDGKTLNAGAVANVTTIKNPISAARRVMEESPHVMLIKEGAEKFAQEQGLEIVDPSWFFTQRNWDALQRAKENELKEKTGTVGCVALDKSGNIAAGTSTGGMTNKKFGRVGDAPIIGAGTYADNSTCGVSATGHGEFFIRNVVAYDISARMKYLNETLETAADDIINNKLKAIGANGGVIAMDKNGNIAMPFNTSAMFRGYLKAGETPRTFIF
jgi:beta-aspartyl-peptidase (threonine type)